MANLKELSDMLGLSQTTVSRALNGYPEVNEATRERVRAAANEINYAPNPSARRLATGKSHTIGQIVPITTHDLINAYFSDFIAGAGSAYNRRGYDMLISVVESSAEAETYRKLKRERRVDGVIVNAPTMNDWRVELLHELEIPFVVHGRTMHVDDSYNWVDVNNRRAFESATRRLIDLGHRRLALVNGWEHMVFAIKRRAGFEAALTAAGLEPDRSLMVSDEMIEPVGYSAMRHFMTLAEPPTAVMCSSMLSTLGVLRAMHELGLQPGKDVSIIAHDDDLSFLHSDEAPMGIAVMRSSIRAMGTLCADMLIDQIENGGPPRNLLLEAEFIDGPSMAPVSK